MNKPTDFNDMAVLQGQEAVKAVIDAAATEQVAVVEEADSKQSQASELVEFVRSRVELFHNKSKEVFATDNATGETRRIDSTVFKDWLLAGYFKQTGKSAREQSLREALNTLAGLGRHDGIEQEVNIRVAVADGVYYLDLAETGKNRVIRIAPKQWEIIDHAPVRFIRTEAMQPLPEPKRGGNIAGLWKVANIPSSLDRVMVLAWLCDCLRPDTPFPVLELLGEQGSAKSTTQTALRRMIDPNSCNLRGAPKTKEDVFVGAGVNWLVSYENISHLSADMQDALCILATGGGYAKRKLYSDADESVIDVKRPVVLNGISEAVTAQDLVDRTLAIETPVIASRAEGNALWCVFDAEHGLLLGALLDTMAKALALLPKMHIPEAERPRLIEFVRLGMAVAEASNVASNQFLAHFNEMRQDSIARTLESSPVAVALVDWFESQKNADLPLKELLAKLDKHKPHNSDAWPKSSKGLGDVLRRVAPALRSVGIECKNLGKIGGVYKWRISRKINSSFSRPESPASPDVAQKIDKQQDMQDFQDMVCNTLSCDSDEVTL